MTFTSTQIYIGADWLLEPGCHKAHPASFGTRRPYLVALPGSFSCLLSCRFSPSSWTAPSLQISLRSRCRLAWCLAAKVLESAGCNRTDQIIRAQVQRQAPKRSNFWTWAHIIPVVNRNHEGFQTNSFTTKIASFNIHITRYILQIVRKFAYNTRSSKLL
jgi:hypothetical protein